MELLEKAVVDIATMVATCHALKAGPVEGGSLPQRKLRKRLRLDIKHAAVAYIDALARTKDGVVDDGLLATCRVAAEQQMARAVARQQWLGRIMASESGSLDGLVAARQDLWRLARLAIHLGSGMTILRGSAAGVDAGSADALARRLRRRFRRALIAYARTTLRAKGPRARVILAARKAALAEIGARGAVEAERLAAIEAGVVRADGIIGRGVTKPLFDLALDWRHRDAAPA